MGNRRSLRSLAIAAPLRCAAQCECPAKAGERGQVCIAKLELFVAICAALVVVWGLS